MTETATLPYADVLPNSRFLRACRGEALDRPPLWIMRQAGRYLPEYQRVRKQAGSFLTLCRTPELAVEVTLQPIRRFGFDASILFSDILIPAEAMGCEVEFVAGEGPKIRNPIQSAEDVAALRNPEPEEACPPVYEAIRMLRQELGEVPLISFAASPFTLACYMIQGETSRDYRTARRFLYPTQGPGDALIQAIGDYTAKHLIAGWKNGASALMLFDSWGGLLGPCDVGRFAIDPTRRVIEAVREVVPASVPIIYFLQGNQLYLDRRLDTGASVLGLDWRIGLDEAAAIVGDRVALQGNLDPAVLLTTPDLVRERALEVLERGTRVPGGHIMNLGHGITPETPIANVETLVETVRAFRNPAVTSA